MALSYKMIVLLFAYIIIISIIEKGLPMKRYMNREQRSEFVTFCTLLGYCTNSFLPKWNKQEYLTPLEKSKMEESITLFMDVKNSILNRMDEDYRDVLKRDSKDLQILTLPKIKAKVTLEKFKEEDETLEVAKIILDTMSSVTLELCSNCHKNLEEQFDCLLRICHFACGIEPFDPDSEGCPFKMTNLDMRSEFFMDFMQNFILEARNTIKRSGDTTYGTETSISANLPSPSKKCICIQKWKGLRRWKHKRKKL
jgi:hypothetical protein